MRPSFQLQLVNDPFGDPALYVEFLFQKRALLFDLGDIHALSPRKLLRLSHVFVSHAHMDHFYGFDYLLRVCLGRARTVHLYGPSGFIERVEHKLRGYTWNLVENYEDELVFVVHEWDGGDRMARARFRCLKKFAGEPLSPAPVREGALLEEPGIKVRAAVLDHKTPCLAFALEETEHVNVWKNRLDELGLPTGPWLQELKQAILRGEGDDFPILVRWRDEAKQNVRRFRLGELKEHILRIVPGLKVGYVVDTLYGEENLRRLKALLHGVDCLYIEASFLQEAAEQAAQKYHLTAWQAGDIARQVGAKRVVPFHFSARHRHEPQRLMQEVAMGFGKPLSPREEVGG
ncbi:MBL fold metallo-hydrolase [Methylothermus subterraneus]